MSKQLRDAVEALLMMFIKDAYSPSGKISKKTALAMVHYVNNDTELQRLVNISDWKSIINYTQALAQEETKQGEPVVWQYTVNGAHILFSDDKPPEDAYDEGSLIPLYKEAPVVKSVQSRPGELLGVSSSGDSLQEMESATDDAMEKKPELKQESNEDPCLQTR